MGIVVMVLIDRYVDTRSTSQWLGTIVTSRGCFQGMFHLRRINGHVQQVMWAQSLWESHKLCVTLECEASDPLRGMQVSGVGSERPSQGGHFFDVDPRSS